MDLDGKATGRGRRKTQRRDDVRHDVAFDIVAVQVDLHGLVGAHTNDDQIVLVNREHPRFGGRPFAMNLNLKSAVFRMSACDHRAEQRGDQQRAASVCELRTTSRQRSGR